METKSAQAEVINESVQSGRLDKALYLTICQGPSAVHPGGNSEEAANARAPSVMHAKVQKRHKSLSAAPPLGQ